MTGPVNQNNPIPPEKVSGGCDSRSEPAAMPPPVPPPHEGWSLALVTGVFAVAALMFYFLDPASAPGFWTCPFHKLTGWYCPGCGGQRALHEVLHGRILAALYLNAFAVLFFLPLAAYAYLAYALRVLGLAQLPRLALKDRHVLALIAVMILFGIVRNFSGPLP